MPRRTCPDCREELEPIELLLAPRAMTALMLHHASPAGPRAWTGARLDTGPLSTWKCPACGLVRMYADQEKDTLPLPADPPEPDPAMLPLPASGPES